METPITYDTSYKWTLSIGTLLLILSLSLPLFKDKLSTNELVVIIIITTLAAILINTSLTEMKETEDVARKYKEELTISEIIKQDLLLIDKEIKEIEYNQIVDEHNKKNTHKLGHKKFRGIESIVRQALDPDFYENVYKGILNKQKKD